MTEAAMHGFFDLSLTMYHLSPKADVFTHTHTHCAKDMHTAAPTALIHIRSRDLWRVNTYLQCCMSPMRAPVL